MLLSAILLAALAARTTLTALATPAHAGDTWTNIRNGVDYLHRKADGQDIYATRIDLTVPNVGIHSSNSTSGDERRVTTPTFASNADVLVGINGDWSDATTPVGLAISDGVQWHNHLANDDLGSRWGYFGCTVDKDCTIDAEKPTDTAWWFTTPTLAPYRYFQAIGMNGEILVSSGAAESGCYDTSRNPRSAMCLLADGTTLWLFVIDGRTSTAAGMTCDETRDMMLQFDCWDGAMLDGGGSSTLVIEGDVKNNPSDGSPRTVANHLGIVYSDSIDPACTLANGRWCDGSVISTCQGGRSLGSGDCAAYGATCEEDGNTAYCVESRCPGGSGSGVSCLDATRAASCNDGVYSEGDCAAFGLVCGTDSSGASCMESSCEAGPNSAFCTDAGLYGSCAAGVYAESDCTATAQSCWEGDGAAACVDPRCTNGPDARACSDAGVLTACAGGVYTEQDCQAAGLECDATAGCLDPGGGGGDDSESSGDAALPGVATPIDAVSCGGGCSGGAGAGAGAGSASAQATGALLALGLVVQRWRRRT